MFKVYRIINIHNGKVYIGKTKQRISKRLSQHVHNAKHDKKSLLYNAIRKYGKKSFRIEKLYEFNNENECNEMEKKLIKENKDNSYNIAEGGNGGFVVQNIEEWKQNLKKSRNGKQPFLGKKHTKSNKNLFKEVSNKYWNTIDTYKKNMKEILKLNHKEAKKVFGISTTHYYRLKNEK